MLAAMDISAQSAARILLIEDDERLAQLVADALHKANYAVTVCGDGLAGEALMRQEPFELVLLDGHLPGKDGFDVLRDTRRDFAGRVAQRFGAPAMDISPPHVSLCQIAVALQRHVGPSSMQGDSR